ncbi:MAG TPA: DUF6531 domain-containing protein, partial [bacterium]|nr:DUF6531 domain-containing protein [bacterium]
MDSNLGIRPHYSFYSHALTPGGSSTPNQLMVNTYSGNVVYQAVDFLWQARVKPGFTRFYNSFSTRSSFLGYGWIFNYDEGLEAAAGGALPQLPSTATTSVKFRDATGRLTETFTITTSGGSITAVTSTVISDFLAVTFTSSTLTITEKNGLAHTFTPLSGTDPDKLRSLKDRNANALDLTWTTGKLTKVSTTVDGVATDLIDTFTYNGS